MIKILKYLGYEAKSTSAEYPFIPSLSFNSQGINFDLTHKRGNNIFRESSLWFLQQIMNCFVTLLNNAKLIS